MSVVGGAWAKIELESIIFHILKFHIYPFQNSSDLVENLCGFPTPTSVFRTLLLQLHRGTGQLSPIHSTSYFDTIPRYKNLWGTIKREKTKRENVFSTCSCTRLPLSPAIICSSAHLSFIHLSIDPYFYLPHHLELKIRTEMSLIVMLLNMIFEMKSKVIFFFFLT